ncbi:MAG: D-aminoacylase [Candidatus Rokubacteria bacterium]|nr:D-aminoacylase [Candidatus Rokubacteria bacterium]
MLELLIRDGLIIDGTGNPGYYGAVAVDGERVRILRGDLDGVQAARVIDARRKVVCPGFIDMHAHSGLVLLAEPRHEPKVHQGITTELIGVDGCSYAPFHSHDDFRKFVQINSGLDGNPPLPGRWSTVEQYLDMFTNRAAVNVVYIVGNSPIRIAGVGWDDRRATARELDDMKAVLRAAMEEGAWGMSTGLDYPPGSYADTAELTALSEQAAALGGIYHTHVRYSLGDRYLDPFREALEIGRGSRIPVHITHFYHRTTSPGGASRMLGLVEDARDEGLDVTFDSYPYNLSSTRLTILLPQWTHDGGYEKLRAVVADPALRDRLRKDMGPRASSWHDMWLTNFKKPANHRFEGRSIAQVADMLDRDPVDVVLDLLADEDLEVSYVSAGGNLATLPKFVSHPLSMVGSDALLIGDYPSPRTYGCFPIILSEYVREERFMSLPDAIRKMTSFPAQRLGLPDRGLLRDGFKADITVFDPRTVKTPATRTQPKQLPVGIDYVVVNGQVVIDGGKHTGVLAGRALRRGRAST